jgi:phosphopantetheinyl transferase
MSVRIKEMNSNELLKKVLLNEHNIKDFKIFYNDNGKPYLVNNNLQFNYSRCENITALVTSKVNVGICIKYFFFNKYIFNNFFNEKEKEQVQKSEKREWMFTRIYTLKIAYLKMLGLNGNYPLDKIDTTAIQNWKTNENLKYFVSVVYEKK